MRHLATMLTGAALILAGNYDSSILLKIVGGFALGVGTVRLLQDRA